MRFVLAIAGLLLLGTHKVRAADPTYWADVRPLLRRNCTVCHNVRTLKERDVSGGLALDSYDAILKSPIKSIVPGNANESELLKRLVRKDATKRMPLDADPLSDENIAIVRRWIAIGAPEGNQPGEPGASATGVITKTPVADAPGSPRKLDVVYPTKYTPPRTLSAEAIPFKTPAELVLPIGPLAPVTALAYNTDGHLLAVGAYGRVTVWDMKAVRPVKVLTNVLGAVNDLKFSSDGRTLAVAGGQPSARGDVRLYDVNGWQLTATLGGHGDVVSSIAFSTDGSRLASASFDKTVRVWDISKRSVAFTFTGHSDFVYAVAWDPKGSWIASTSKDRTIKVVDAKTGQTRLTLSGMDQDVLALAATIDGGQIVSSGFESQIHWWNAKTGERMRKITGHDVAVHEICASRDGKFVATAGADKTLRFWNVSTGQSMRVIHAGSMLYSVTLSPEASRAVAGSFDGFVRVYDPTNGKLMVTMSANGEDWLAMTPEGYLSASDGWANACRWRIAGQELPTDLLRAALRKPEFVSKLAAGLKVPEPAIPR